MRTITMSVTVYSFDELDPQAQDHAIEQVRQQQIDAPWDSTDIEMIEESIVYALAEALRAPGWDTYGEGDFPGIPHLNLREWDLDRGQSLTVSGYLDRANAPGLPWVDGIDAVELGAVRHGTEITVTVSEPDCTCPVDTYWHAEDCAPVTPAVTDQHICAMEDAVTDAVHAAWTAGRDELEYWHSTDYARELVANGTYEFTVDGDLYPAD
jgi:hypothetical protein